MIVEKRTRLRKSKPTEPALTDIGNSNLAKQAEEPGLNFCSETYEPAKALNFDVPADWEDELEMEHEVTSSCIVMVFIVLTGFSAFAMGSYFFTC
jgi:hypothetical protein